MSDMAWRFALASVIGTSHLANGTECQDVSACEVLHSQSGEAVLVAVAADGAGSAELSGIGARLACSLFVDEVRTLLQSESDIGSLSKDFMTRWLEQFRREIGDLSTIAGKEIRDYACTILACVIGDRQAVFAQVGDGAIVISDRENPDDMCCISWPQKGEYENLTFFATDTASAASLFFEFVEHPINDVALFTDGIERLALNFTDRSAYAPFFTPLFTEIRTSGQRVDACGSLSDSLKAFLSCARVNKRTDDDKTLILASRSPIAPAPTLAGSSQDATSQPACVQQCR